MAKQSAGIVLYRLRENGLEVLLLHPGGPFWAKKDLGVWSIAKGELGENEAPESAAIREFEEETGFKISGELIALKPVKLKTGKQVHAFAVLQDLDASEIKSNLFEMEWPPKSGKFSSFPEMDKAAWFSFGEAKQKINSGQIPLLEELEKLI